MAWRQSWTHIVGRTWNWLLQRSQNWRRRKTQRESTKHKNTVCTQNSFINIFRQQGVCWPLLSFEVKIKQKTALLTWQRRTPAFQEEVGVHSGRKSSASCWGPVKILWHHLQNKNTLSPLQKAFKVLNTTDVPSQSFHFLTSSIALTVE